MKSLFIFSSFLLCVFSVQGQDLVDFFRWVPLPYSWRMNQVAKECLLEHGRLTEDYIKQYKEKDKF